MHSPGWRIASAGLGAAAAALGMYGAYQFGLKLEGGVSYLTIAAPVVALAATLIPPFAEEAWRSRQHGKSLLWCAVLVPAALTVFFGTAERVHVAKAGPQAERQALRNVAERAKEELAEAKREAAEAQAEVRKAEAKPACKASCKETKLARGEASARVETAERSLVEAEAKAATEASLRAPEWLLPASLDFIAFMGIWSGLAGPRPASPKGASRKKAKAKARKPKAKTPDAMRALRIVK